MDKLDDYSLNGDVSNPNVFALPEGDSAPLDKLDDYSLNGDVSNPNVFALPEEDSTPYQSDLDSIFEDAVDEEGQGSPVNIPPQNRNDEGEDYLYGRGDWNEYVWENGQLGDEFDLHTTFLEDSKIFDRDASEEKIDPIQAHEPRSQYSEQNDGHTIEKPLAVGDKYLVSLSSGCGRPDLEEDSECLELDGLGSRDSLEEYNASDQNVENLPSMTDSLYCPERVDATSEFGVGQYFNGSHRNRNLKYGKTITGLNEFKSQICNKGCKDIEDGLHDSKEPIINMKKEDALSYSEQEQATSSEFLCYGEVENNMESSQCHDHSEEDSSSSNDSISKHSLNEKRMQTKMVHGSPSSDKNIEGLGLRFIDDSLKRDEDPLLWLEQEDAMSHGQVGGQSIPDSVPIPLDSHCLSNKYSKGEDNFKENCSGSVLSTQFESGLMGATKERKPEQELEVEEMGPDELSRYVEALAVDESYIDTISDMENVLLSTYEATGEQFFKSTSVRPARDGSPGASTSGSSMVKPSMAFSTEIASLTVEWIEVIGAKQKRGGVSLGERIVGVKDHTVYRIRVWSGKKVWEIERRYRNFVQLCRQLRQYKLQLPPHLEEAERESRKVFGNTSPDIVEARSALLQRCLQSLLHAGPPLSTAPPLLWFLFPTDSFKEAHLENTSQSLHLERELDLRSRESDPPILNPEPENQDGSGSAFVFGKTIRLVLEIHSSKSLKQLLYAQHFLCAGCYKPLDVGGSLMQSFAKTLGWGGPRQCEYSGQLFCNSCHVNEAAVLPARVLRLWDFTPRRVSQLAKAFLDSIYDQPMLCVSAVNPYLNSRVPILSHITEIRRKLSKIFAFVRCPLRAQIQKTLGSRRYLLESNDFFALHDLEDLSKGAFAVLPGLLKALSEKLILHITQQCSVCGDIAESCSAGALCEEPHKPVFAFQDDTLLCEFCHLSFHKLCLQKCKFCPSCSNGQMQHVLDGDEEM